eukprot:403365858
MNSKNLTVTISANDVDLDNEYADLDKSQLGFYINFGNKLLDVLVLSQGQNSVKVPLIGPESQQRITVIVKSLGRDEVKIGSISIPQEIFYMAGESKHRQWITLFDHLDDDEYDGEMGENDDEQPRVLFTFEIAFEQDKPKSQPPQAQPSAQTTTKPKHNLNQGRSPVRQDPLPTANATIKVDSKKSTPYQSETSKTQPAAQQQQQPQMQSIMKKPAGRQAVNTHNPMLNNNNAKTQPKAQEYQTQQPQSLSVHEQRSITPPKRQASPFKPTVAHFDDFDIQRELQKDQSKKYRVDFLQKLLDDKLNYLVQTINDKQKENSDIEDEVLTRLQLLKSLNSQIESVYTNQSQSYGELQKQLALVEQNHSDIIENDEEKLKQEARLKELEKQLQVMRVEVETVGSQNEKLKLSKEERLSRDLNSRVFADHKPNDQMREQLKEADDKRQNQRDQERDYNRDIFQLAKDYKRKVEEFNSLLISYASERNDLSFQLQSLNTDLIADRAFNDLDIQKSEKFKTQIALLKDTVKSLEAQIEDKKKQGEEIYNQMRDQVSLQEDKIRLAQDEALRLKGQHIQRLEQEKADCENDIQRLESFVREFQGLPTELKKCEQQLDKARDKREKARQELEIIKRRLEVVVDVKIIEADLEEARTLCETIDHKDRELLLNMMRARDDAKKEWLKNWVNTEVHELMRRDRDDVRNHIEMYADDLQKLQKIIDKFIGMQQKQQERCHENTEELRLMQNEMNGLAEERKDCERELKLIQQDMAKLKQDLENKKREVERRQLLAQKLDVKMGQQDQEIDRLNDILNEKDDILGGLEDNIKQTGETLAASLYSAIKGDLVDELLAKYINLTQCPVPIKRLGNGYYLFGTKKIFAKIMNGKLVIRVGGGFMVIEEFIAAYAEQEMKKIHAMEANQMMSDGDATGKSRGSGGGYASNKKSPRASGGSPRADAFKKKQ